MVSTRALVCSLLLCLLCLGVAGVVGAGDTGTDDQHPTAEFTETAGVSIADDINTSQETVSLLVGFEEPADRTGAAREPAQLQDAAATAQTPLVSLADETDGLSVDRQFWITNAALVTLEPGETPVGTLADVEGVETIASNARVQSHSPGSGAGDEEQHERSAGDPETDQQSVDPDAVPVTAGLEQIGAPAVWDAADTQGAGTSVAVLDSGVDAGHPDIDLADWAAFDGEGDQRGIDPRDFDPNGHGTHVSATVAGGAASGLQIGVAPETALYHGAVLTDCDASGCGGTTAQVLAGIEWAVANDVDVVSMSLGARGYRPTQVGAVRNALDAGTIVVASSGNDGHHTSGSPGNVYESIAVGAVEQDGDIAGFSSGERVRTAEAWGTVAPGEWPDRYVVPTITAPGVGVRSALPNDAYGQRDGTSMAAPHVAGGLALLQAATATDHPPAVLAGALETTATKPANWSKPTDRRDTRYGTGTVDLLGALDGLAEPTAAFRVEPNRPAADEETTLDATVAAGDIDAYEWDLTGDGTVDATGPTVAHPFDASGNHDVTLTVETVGGQTDTTTRTVRIRERWSFDTGSPVASSPTVVSLPGDGMDSVAVVGGTDGTVVALNGTSGERYWETDLDGAIEGAPAYAELTLGGSADNGTVFVGSSDGDITALDAGTGARYWQFDTGGAVHSSPTVGDGTVFVGSTAGAVYGLDAVTGDPEWRFDTGGSVRSSAAVSQVAVGSDASERQTVFVGSSEGLHAVDGPTGEQRWLLEMSSGIQSAPTVADVPASAERHAGAGPTASGPQTTDETDGQTVFAAGANGVLYALDPATGETRWFENLALGIQSSPTVGNASAGGERRSVFVGGTDGTVYALDTATGERDWSFDTSDWVVSSPTVADGTVFVGSGDDFLTDDTNLYALDGETGKQHWRFETTDAVRSAPTVTAAPDSASGDTATLFVGSDDGRLYALDAGVDGPSDGSRVRGGVLGHHDVWADQAPTALFGADPVRPTEPFDLLPNETMTVDASPTTGDIVDYGWSVTDADEHLGNGNRVAGQQEADELQSADGPTETFTFETEGTYAVTLTATDTDGESATRTRTFRVADPDTTDHWAATLDGGVSGSPTIVDVPGLNETAFVGTDNGTVVAIDGPTGETIWSNQTTGAISGAPAVVGGTVFVGTDDGSLLAFDAATGEDVWANTTGGEIRAAPTVDAGTVYVGTMNGTILARDAATGADEWTVETGGGVRSSVTVSPAATGPGENRTAFVGSGDGRVYALDAATGATQWTASTGGPVFSSPTVAPATTETGTDDRFLYVGSLDSAVYALNLTTGDEAWTVETGAPVWSSPTVGADSAAGNDTVYVGSSDDSLYALDALSGSIRWQFDTGGSVRSSPTVAGDTVAVGSMAGTVYGLDAGTGAFNWRLETAGGVESSPVIANVSVDGPAPTLFVGSDDGRLHASDAETATESSDSRVLSGTLGHHGAWAAQPPVPRFSVDPVQPHPGENATLDAGTTFGTVATYEWDLTGDGTPDETGRTVTHTFPDAGDHTVTLTVTTHDGMREATTRAVPVRADLPPVVGEDPPRDLTGDGLYEDIDGDGVFDIFDVQVLFGNLDTPALQDHAEYYNFAGQDSEAVGIFDVQALFARLN